MYKTVRLFIGVLIGLFLTGCVSSIDTNLPYPQLPTITVGAEVALVASPTHPTAYLPVDPLPAGAMVQVVGANEDNSWLLVLNGDTLGWMPTLFSRTNVSTFSAAIILTSLDSNCTKFLSTSASLGSDWAVGSPGSAIIQGSLYRPQMGDSFDDAVLAVSIEEDGIVTAADYIHTPLTEETGVIFFAVALDGLTTDSQIRFDLTDADSEPVTFQAALYSNDCPEQIDVGSSEFTDLLPVGVLKAETPQIAATQPDLPAGPDETGQPAKGVLEGEVLAEILSVRSGPGFVFDHTGDKLRGERFVIQGRVCGGPGGYDWLLIESSRNAEAWIPGAPHLVKIDDVSALTCRAPPPTPTPPATTVTIQRAGTLLASKLVTDGAEAADYLTTVARYRLAMKAAVALPNSPTVAQLGDYAEGEALNTALNEVRQLRARRLSGEFTITQMDVRFIALYDIGKAALLVDEVHTLVRQRAMASGSQPVEIQVYEGPVVYRMTYRAGMWRVSEVVLLNSPVQAQGVGNPARRPGPAEEGAYLQQARAILAERNVHQVSLDVLLPAVDTSAFVRPSGQTLEGRVSANTVLEQALGPYVIRGSLSIDQGVTLFIEPGTVVKFTDDAILEVYGTLVARGTRDRRIIFTSFKDDFAGGDTNGDGASSAPNPGDWTFIRFRDSSNDASSVIEQAIIRYAGESRGNWHGAIYLESASPTIVNNIFERNLWYAISADPQSFPVVSGNVLAGNGGNGLQIREGDMRISGVWRNTDIPYAVTGRVTVHERVTLTIDPGAVVKFGDDIYLDIYGSFRAIGTPGERIVFTSLKDDTVGGDTNGDQESSAPSPGDWTFIRFRDSSNDANSVIKQSVIRYAGENRGNWHGAVYLESASPTIVNNTFERNLWSAVSGDPQSFPTVSGNVLVQNGINGLEIREGDMRISGTWRNTDMPYVLTRRVAIAEGATLTIDPGAVVKFGDDAYFDVYGAFRAVGAPDHPVIFTSLKDDTVLGDTNGDGSSSAPSPGDWTMIRFRDSSNDANSIIEQTVLRYGGEHRGSRYGIIHLEAASPAITNNVIENSYSYAIWSDVNSAPRLDGNSFSGNREGDVFQAQR